jgi:hypothetical protein
MDSIPTALSVNFVEVLLGIVVAVGSALIAGSSLWAVVRRHRAEEHYLLVLTDNMRKIYFMRDRTVLEHAKDGALTESEKEDLRKVIFDALTKLDDPTDKDSIQKALKQPSPRGRNNYEIKILSESARRALQEPGTTNAARGTAKVAERQARRNLREERSADPKGTTRVGTSKPPDTLTHVRRNIYSLPPGDPSIGALREGIEEMKNRPPSDPTSWRYQASIYGTRDSPPDQQAARLWNQGQLGNFFFLSWNRMYLYFFERILRAASGDPNLALPYWDYSNPAQRSLPIAFRQPADASNPLYVAQRGPGINQGDSLPASAVSPSTAFALVNFSPPRGSGPSFGGGRVDQPGRLRAPGQLEMQPHNSVHILVGGWMSIPIIAARDPVFLLHHSNIDRLWKRWLDQGGGRANPIDDPTWMDTEFTFFDENGYEVSMRGRDILDTVDQLDYHYDDDPPNVLGLTAVVEPKSAAIDQATDKIISTTLGESGGKRMIELGATPTVVPIELADEATDVVAELTQGGAAERRITLSVEGVQYDEPYGDLYELYLNLPEGQEPDFFAEHFVGILSLFSREQPKVEFDVTDNVLALAARGKWEARRATVTFVRRGLEESAELEAKVAVVPGQEEQRGHLRIERVALRTVVTTL